MTTLELLGATVEIQSDLTWRITANPGMFGGTVRFAEDKINTLLHNESRIILSVSPAPDYDLAARLVSQFPNEARILNHTPDPDFESPPPEAII